MTRRNTRALARQLRAVLPEAAPAAQSAADRSLELGEPLDIKAAARLVGCSAWTLRHSLIPQGFPCFRTGANGKLIFYREQIIRWIERRQRLHGGAP